MKEVLSRLLRPRSIALVGASDDPRSVGGLLLSNLELFGYAGDIRLVSRTRTEVNGRPCVRSIDDLPTGIDAVVLNVPQNAVVEMVDACGRRGVGGAVVFASGFAETGDAGALVQRDLAATAERHGMALLGPNCMGFSNFTDRAPLTFEAVEYKPRGNCGGIAILAQSGAMNGNVRQALIAKGLDVAFSISTGNEASVGVEDLMDYLVDSDDVQVFALFVETIRKPVVFLRAAGRARELGKPVVLMHPGRSSLAREAAQSHTGAMAGDHGIMRTLVEREGVVVVETTEELFDVTHILSAYPHPVSQAGTSVASNSGALRGFTLDFCESIEQEFAGLSDATIGALKVALPEYASVDNPLDLTAQGMQQPELFGIAARAMLDDPAVGTFVMPIMGGSPAQQVSKATHILPVLSKSTKPVALVYMGGDAALGSGFIDMLAQTPVPFFRSPERALRAMAHVHRRGRFVDMAKVQAVAAPVPEIPATLRGPLAEYKGKALLRDLGVPVPKGALAHDVDEAIALAAGVGYPVVLKAQADELTHKSDVGGVKLGISNEAALRDAWDRMQADVATGAPHVQLQGLLVEAMSPSGLELVVGARRDPEWGVVMMVGLGGIWIEVLKDFRLLAPNLDEAQIASELRKLKGAKLLDGIRGKPPVDVRAIAAVVRRLSDLMMANPHISEIDINPLVAYRAGEDVVALDALFVLGQ